MLRLKPENIFKTVADFQTKKNWRKMNSLLSEARLFGWLMKSTLQWDSNPEPWKKMSMYRTQIFIINNVNFWPPSPEGGGKKNYQINVCFFWNRLYSVTGVLWTWFYTNTQVVKSGVIGKVHLNQLVKLGVIECKKPLLRSMCFFSIW